MKYLIPTALIAATLSLGATPAHADDVAPCAYVSSVSVSDTRPMAGRPGGPTTYGPIRHRHHHLVRLVTRYTYTADQHRIVTATTTQCEGQDATTTITFGNWSSGMIVRTQTWKRVCRHGR